MMEKYNSREIEPKWQKLWEKWRLAKADDNSDKEKRYVLDMFPYPSAAGLHVGHVESYAATDIYSRYLKLRGYNVMHPQGWDAFGLPAENYAIKTGAHPSKTTQKAIANYKKQINSIGLLYDWSREINSSDPDYYRWTQWLFLLFYKNGLAYKKKARVNWCDSCQTVLANEQVVEGKCERCGTVVGQKELEQWFFKITDFIEDQDYKGKKIKGLLSGLDDVDWPESTKRAQKNWIGRSEGASVKFEIRNSKFETNPKSKIQNPKYFLEAFTTRPDTLFGCTYMVVAPEHELIKKYEGRITNYEEVKKYIEAATKKTELERTELAKDKTGVRLEGVSAMNPVNNKEIPIFAADYVLGGYGTGAIMAVPAHDQRDWEFAKKYRLPIVEVVSSSVGYAKAELQSLSDKMDSRFRGNDKKEAFTGDGINVNSSFLDGLPTSAAKEKMIKWLEGKGLGKRTINYKIRDWLIGRQRYWGAPIPIIYCELCGEQPVPEKDLPVVLPTDVDFKPTGQSPLIHSKTFHRVTCPNCGAPARREVDTMDTFVCSSWYYLRYADPKNYKEFAAKKQLERWLPVDVYVGGAEHTVLHLLYSRFFTKALEKFGYLNFNEPFLKLRHQGLILAENGSKMSKSKGNVVNPDEVVEQFGADSLRMYEMFMGPLEDAKPWNTRGIIGIKRFLEKVWKLYGEAKFIECRHKDGKCRDVPAGMPQLLHKTIKKVGEDIENFRFNTAIAQMMIFINFVAKFNTMPRTAAGNFLIILSPLAPHLAEELWQKLGNKESIFLETWPKYSPALVKEEKISFVIQVNGKVRGNIEVAADISEAEAKKIALESELIKKWLAGKEVVKIIFVAGKLINLVVE